jgi:hypothetical protein
VLNLWLLLLVVAITIMALIWAGALFLQSYLYTMPSQQLHWQAPAAGALVGGFFTWWCFAVATSPEARPDNIPYNAILFTVRVDMVKEPVKELWAVKKTGEKVKYTSQRLGQRSWIYKDSLGRAWNGAGVITIELEHDGEKYRFEPAKTETGGYPYFQNDKGWTMKIYENGPNGIPDIVRTGRLLANLFFNIMHLAVWFVGLWLLVRFQWSHALLLAFCLWLLFSLAILPMMLGYAAGLAQARSIPMGA